VDYGNGNGRWTTATGTGAPVRAGSPTFTTNISTPQATFDDQNASPDAVGELLYDNTITGITDGALVWYDDDEVRVINDSENQPVPMNLITNSGFGVWSNSDTNKGLGSLTYDAGTDNDPAGDTPDVGDAVTGDTSSATCKIIAITTATGAWADDDATGVLTLGACTGRFQDNETVSFTDGEDATVNMPNSAAGVDLLQNGDFSVDTDPPPGWTASGATLTTDAAGQVGNMMTVTSSGDALGKAYQDITTVVGKLYKLELYFKKGTSDDGKFMVGTTGDEDAIYDSGALTDAAWAAKSHSFEATATTTRITMQTTDPTTGETSLFDEIACYEITPNMTSGSDGPDGWQIDSTLDVYRQHNDGGTLTRDGSFYSLLTVSSSANDFMFWPKGKQTLADVYQSYAGRTVTAGAWVKTSTASHVRLRVYDGVTGGYSSYHTGGGGWEWLSATVTVDGTPDRFQSLVYFSVVGATAYISQPQLSFASSLPEGGYMQPPGEWVNCDARIIAINQGSAATGDAGSADDKVLYLEALSEGMIPKGATAIDVTVRLRNSAAVTDDGLFLRATSAATDSVLICNPLVNNLTQSAMGIVQCDSNGDIYQVITEAGETLSKYDLWINRIQVAP